MAPSINRSFRCRLVASLVLLFFACSGSERCLVDSALVARASKGKWRSGSSSGRGKPPSDSISSPSSQPRQSNDELITSIARLRSLVTPAAYHLPGCVLFLNATSARASGCSASRPRRLRQDPPPSFPLVAGVPSDGDDHGGEGNDGDDSVIVALRAGDDTALLDLLLLPRSDGGGNSTAGGDDEGEKRRKRLLSTIAGVVALPGPPPKEPWSPDDANPQSEYCPYPIPDNFTGWVPGAKGLLRRPLPFPIVASYGEFAWAVASAAGVGDDDENEKRRRRRRKFSHLAALDDEMEAAVPSPGTSSNSSHCLSQGTCGPIGGHSVWASLPAMTKPKTTSLAFDDGDVGPTPTRSPPPPPPPPKNSSTTPRTVVLAAASDARQLLHGGSAGAGALSGLVSLLAAAEALGNATRSFARSSTTSSSPFGEGGRVLFLALSSEPWGFLGSRRLLWEARDRSKKNGTGGGSGDGEKDETTTDRDDAAGGFPLSEVSWLIELGSVGDPPLSNASDAVTLFAHPGTTPGSKEGPAAALVDVARNSSSSSPPLFVSLPSDSASLPGPPPGSLWAWATAAPAISSAFLSSHEASLGGEWSSSRWDDAERLDARAVAAAAAVAARAAASAAGASPGFLELADGESSPPVPFLSAEAVLPRVTELISCLVARQPGLGGSERATPPVPPCPLSLELLGRDGSLEAAASALDGGGTPHHAGPLATLTSDPQTPDPLSKKPYSRFLWEFLARATREEEGGGGGPVSCDPLARKGAEESCPVGRVCARSPLSPPSKSSSVCIRSTAAFVASYPLNLECVGCDGADNYGNWQVFVGGGRATGAKNETEEEKEKEEKQKKLLPNAAAAEAWRASLGWPPEPLWAESDWREGVPSLSVWQVAGASSPSPSSGVLILWSLAVAATAGCWFAAASAKGELRRTRWSSYDEGEGEDSERGGGEQQDLFIPSF